LKPSGDICSVQLHLARAELWFIAGKAEVASLDEGASAAGAVA